MQIPEDLQPRVLLVHPAALAKHLQTILLSDPSQENLSSINSYILHQVYTEAVSSFVYQVWLFIAYRHSPHLLFGALCDQKSAGVRRAGSKVLRHIFRKKSWKTRGWDPLGGAQGIKTLLDGLPLAQVRWFVKAISPGPGGELFAICIDDLVANIDSSDTWTTRSLSTYMAPLYACCTSKRVTEILRSSILCSGPFYRELGRRHSQLLRQIANGTVEVPPKVRRRILDTCVNALLQSNEAYVPIHATDIPPDIPPGLKFGLDLLSHIRADEPDLWTNQILIRRWTELVVRLAIRRNLPFDSILPIISSSLEMCRVADSSDWLSQYLPVEVIRCWSLARFGASGHQGPFYPTMRRLRASSPSRPSAVNQAALEYCLIQQVLKSRDERLSVQRTQATFTRELCKLLSYVHIDGKLEFLQLLCRHSPTLNFDLTVWPPSEEERKLIPVWEYDVLRGLPVSSSKALFRRILQSHHCDTYLPSDLVERNSWKLFWENQCSLWAKWEGSTAKTSDDFPVTLKALAEMKKRATRDRESSERLKWARSAIKLASETKSVSIFCDLVKWSQRFLRDQKTFPSILALIYFEAKDVFSCGADTRVVKPISKLDLRADVQKAHLTLKGLLESLLLLLREPWARNMRSMTSMVPSMLSTIVRQRMVAVRYYLSNELAPESELVETLLDSTLPLIIDFEREGNIQGQAVFSWSGPAGAMGNVECPSSPSRVDLSFMDRLAKARDKLWKDLRARNTPDISTLEPCWPRGLPIQRLVMDSTWLYHALERPEEAPFLSSRLSEILFSPRDIVVAAKTHPLGPIPMFVDDLGYAIRAMVSREADKTKSVTLIWKHYSSILQTQLLHLEIFEDWLVGVLRDGCAVEAINIVRPPSSPRISLISKVPMVPEVTKWNPHQDAEDMELGVPLVNEKRPREIPRILLNYRMHLPMRIGDESFVRTREIKPQSKLGPIGFWLDDSSYTAGSKDLCVNRREAVILSALLILDHYTSQPRLLGTGFPEAEGPRYGPTNLSDEFVTRVIKPEGNEVMTKALVALEGAVQHVPAQILRDLIYSFLDTLKASPNAPNYPKLLHCTFELIKLLLHSSQPQLMTGVALRVWKEFPHDSSSHRKMNLVKIGRILTPDQAGDLMQTFVMDVCDTLQRQREPGDIPAKPFVKITTAKMLVQALAEADFLAPSTQLHLLRSMYGASSHIDVRVEIVKAFFNLIRPNQNDDVFQALSTIALSSAVGPSERHIITEDSWRAAEAGASLPLVSSSRPILDLIISDAATNVPKELHSDYVQKVVLRVVTESIRQHTRWMTVLLARLGLSLSGLGLTAADIGPFPSDLINNVLRKWARYLPATYLQYHRSWGLMYLHRDSFNRISEALASSTDPIKEDANVRDHLQALLRSQRDRCPFDYTYRSCFLMDSKVPNGITDEILLDDFRSRVELFSKCPVAYNHQLGRYSVHPSYTLCILQRLRKARGDLGVHFPSRYSNATKLMMSIVEAAELVRKEGWSPELSTHLVAVPATFEYEVQMLPSPSRSPLPSNSALGDFVSGIIGMISKYAADPVLLIKVDSFAPILREVRQDQREDCALLLGEDFDDGDNRDRLVKVWVRVKLAVLLLETAHRAEVPLNERTLGMIERWKGSDIEMVRQAAWAWDWKGSK